MADVESSGSVHISVSDLVDTAPVSRFHFRVITLCASLVFFDGFDVQAISYTAPALASALGLTRPLLGPVFSAGVLGLAVGSLLFGLLGDRFGRKIPFICCGLMFGVASFATAHANTLDELMFWRAFAGLGLGGATPIALTIATDYCPKRLRAALVITMYTSFAIGGILAGIVATALGETGWRAVFHIGGAAPIFLAPLLVLALPESLEYLVSQDKRRDAARIVTRLYPNKATDLPKLTIASVPSFRGFSAVQLFRGGLAAQTILLWLVFLTSLIAIYFYTSWVPTLLKDIGLSPGHILSVTTAGHIGGVAGALLLASLTLRFHPLRVIAVGYLMGAVAFLSIYWGGRNFGYLLVANATLGCCLIGAQYGLNAIAAQFYSPHIRSTGVGWAIGVGRIGGTWGPSLAGLLLALGWSSHQLFLGAAFPAILACLVTLALARVTRKHDPIIGQADLLVEQESRKISVSAGA